MRCRSKREYLGLLNDSAGNWRSAGETLNVDIASKWILKACGYWELKKEGKLERDG